MQISKSTVDRELRFIRSWLYRRIHSGVAVDAAEA